MPLSPAPTGPTDWATVLQNNGPLGGPNRIDPSTARQQAGWYWGDKPDYETLNGWMYNMSQKIDWAVSGVETHDSQIGGLGTTFGIDENNMSTVAFPGGGTYSNTGVANGAIKITLPQSWSDTKLKFIVDIFEETTGVTSSLLISGVNLSSGTQWTDTMAATVAGSKSLRVRFGHDGVACFILIGSIGDTFINPHVRIRDFTAHGGSLWQYTNWVTGWAISMVTSEVGFTFTGDDIQASSSAAVEVGSVIVWTGNSAPAGYLELDGSTISRTTYADLFAAMGTIYGVGDGSTTFNIPDFRGEFLRGWDNGAGNDPDAGTRTNRGDGTTGDNIGTKQADEIKSHIHQITLKTSGGFTEILSGASATAAGVSQTDAFGGNETRPRNINVMFCVKY